MARHGPSRQAATQHADRSQRRPRLRHGPDHGGDRGVKIGMDATAGCGSAAARTNRTEEQDVHLTSSSLRSAQDHIDPERPGPSVVLLALVGDGSRQNVPEASFSLCNGRATRSRCRRAVGDPIDSRVDRVDRVVDGVRGPSRSPPRFYLTTFVLRVVLTLLCLRAEDVTRCQRDGARREPLVFVEVAAATPRAGSRAPALRSCDGPSGKKYGPPSRDASWLATRPAAHATHAITQAISRPPADVSGCRIAMAAARTPGVDRGAATRGAQEFASS